MSGEGPKAPSGRIRCIDWLRGLAVFDMIMWHTGALLAPGHDTRTLGWLAGLVAPSFMFAAGFAIALVMVRAAGDPAARRRRALKSLQRIAEVLGVAFVLKVLLRMSEPYWVLKLDILTCIALALLAAWPVQVLLSRRPALAAGVCAALGTACFAVAPLIPDGFWGVLIAPNSSDFAPIPWAGYIFLGGACGALASGGTRGLGWSLAGVVALGAVFRFGTTAWATQNSGERLLVCGALALALMGIELDAARNGATLKWPPFTWIERVGTNALTAYVAHIWLLFIPIPPAVLIFRHVHIAPLQGRWGGRASWAGYWAAVIGLWAATVLICWAWPRLSARFPWNRPKPRAA